MATGSAQPPRWNAPMEGQGAYNRHSYRQADSGAVAVPLLQQAAHLIDPAPDDQLLLIADYGSSQGRNSLGPLRAAIAVLRERFGGDRAICVAHTDLPDNDFSTLFHMLHTDSGSYLNGDPNVYASAVGRTFYESVLPPAQVSLGWCANAAHWPSCIAARVSGHYWSLRATGSARLAFEAQCAHDWRTFLSLRASCAQAVD